MATIIINMSDEDIGNLLLDGEIYVDPSIQKFDNLTGIILKRDKYGYTRSEVENYDE